MWFSTPPTLGWKKSDTMLQRGLSKEDGSSRKVRRHTQSKTSFSHRRHHSPVKEDSSVNVEDVRVRGGGEGSTNRSLVTFDRRSLPTLVRCQQPAIPHHHPGVCTSRMRGVRIVEQDENKGCRTIFRFTASSEGSAQEAGPTEVSSFTFLVVDRQTQHPLTRLCWKNIQAPQIPVQLSSAFSRMYFYPLGTPTAFLRVGVPHCSRRFCISGADSPKRLLTVGSYVSGWRSRR